MVGLFGNLAGGYQRGGLLGLLDTAFNGVPQEVQQMEALKKAQTQGLLDQMQTQRGQQSRQASLFGGYDPMSGINWSGPGTTYDPQSGKVKTRAETMGIDPRLAPMLGMMAPQQAGQTMGNLAVGQIERDQARQDKADDRAARMQDWRSQFDAEAGLRREIAGMQARASQGDPSSVREWQYFSGLPEAQQQQYLAMKRAPGMVDLGYGQAMVNPLDPTNPRAVLPKGTAPQDKITDTGIVSTPGRPGGSGIGPLPSVAGAVGQFAPQPGAMPQPGMGQPQQPGFTPIPRDPRDVAAARDKASQGLNIINQALSFPNRQEMTGPIQGRTPNLTGPAQDFKAIMDQLGGQTFLQAFESLKGGGQITQVEGEKATAAIARLNTAQSDQAFEDSLRELQSIMQRSLERTSGVPESQMTPIYQPAWAQRLTDPRRQQPVPAGSLTPEEERELQELRQRFGRQ